MNKSSTTDFFIALEDLIEAYSHDKNLENKPGEEEGFHKDFLALLQLSIQDGSDTKHEEIQYHENNERLEKKFIEFIKTLENTDFDNDLVPYDKITKKVFEKTPPEKIDEFTPELKRRGDEYFKSNNNITPEKEKNFYRIIRHINLAIIQKNSFITIQIDEIDNLKSELMNIKSVYNQLKEENEKQYKNLTTHTITILGIFAAILMGAFGAIQGFTSMFNNAHRLNLGELLIISSIGAAAVILILFFLLNSISKLIDKPLSNNHHDYNNIFKYPTLVISSGILVLIFLIGAAIELSNTKLVFSWYGLWWILPVLWLIYFTYSFKKESFLWPFNFINRLKNK